jgi:hypothetical protein
MISERATSMPQRYVLVLQRFRRLDLDHIEPAVRALEDIDHHEHVVGQEACLEDRQRAGLQRGRRLRHPRLHRVVRQVDEHAAGEARPCERPHLVALVEPVLERLVGYQLRRVVLVHLPPEVAEALAAGDEARLGPTVDPPSRPVTEARP